MHGCYVLAALGPALQRTAHHPIPLPPSHPHSPVSITLLSPSPSYLHILIPLSPCPPRMLGLLHFLHLAELSLSRASEMLEFSRDR